MLPRFPTLVPVDPDILLLVMAVGAVVGAIGAGLNHVLLLNAQAQGGSTQMLPEVPGYLEHKQ